jgi:hypothetical protein
MNQISTYPTDEAKKPQDDENKNDGPKHSI